MPAGRLLDIPQFVSTTNRDAVTTWTEGDLCYVSGLGYRYYDGAAWQPLGTPMSFLRAFGPDASSPLPANAWTAIGLDPAGEPWRQFGTATWEWIGPGDPDYALSPAGIRCLREGVYDFAGSVVFNPAQATGTRGVQVVEVKGPYAGQWQLTTSIPVPKSTNTPLIVAGEAYQYAGNIVELRAWTDTATSTMANPQSEWLSATLIAGP